MKKIINHPGLGNVIYTKRKSSRTIRVRIVSDGDVQVSLPCRVSFAVAAAFVDRNRKRIEDLMDVRKKKIAGKTFLPGLSEAELQDLRKNAGKILPARASSLAAALLRKIREEDLYKLLPLSDRFKVRIKEGYTPFAYGRLAIKNNKSNWGSCSSLNNLNLNMQLLRLPADLMDFVIIHELCHLVYHNHGPGFHALLDALCDGMEKEKAGRLKRFIIR
ncbi:MAG: M48 family metallopeptidase [Bacteroidales bacterium]|jgi:predicted metal-dependent hydrolase|nr:M48 family metallopeptidase [Bacteroidales bacterium]